MTIAHRCHRCGRVEATTRLPIPYGWHGLTRRRIWVCEPCIEAIADADARRLQRADLLIHYEARALRARRAAHRMVERHGRTEELRRYCAGGDPSTTKRRGES